MNKDFNGVNLVIENTSLSTYYEDKINDFMENLISAESNYPEMRIYSGDSIRLHRNGSIRIDNIEFKITEAAFNQVLTYLGIPVKFCSRLSKDIFFDLINKMLSEQYDKTFSVKIVTTTSPGLIIGFHPLRKLELPTVYQLFSHLLRKKDMDDRNTSFMAGVVNGLTYAMYLVFDDTERYKKQSNDKFKGPMIWDGVEILFSPVSQVKPTVTSCVIGEGFAAMNRGASFKLDTKTTGMNSVAPCIETYIRNVRTNSPHAIETFENSFSTKISPRVDSFIRRRLPKVVNSRFISEDFIGNNAAEVLSKIHESGANDTLPQRRKTLFFIWDVLKEL